MIPCVGLKEALLLCVMTGVALSATDYCTIGTCTKGEHTLCKYPNDTVACPGSGVQTGLTDEQKTLILDRHNVHRQTVAQGKESPQPAASNMRELVWNDEAATIAQRWANQCVFDHDACRNLENQTVGQNIASHSLPLTGANVSATLLDMVDNWYAEVKDFDKAGVGNFSAPKGGKDFLHYTQLVWAETAAVGCGFLQKAAESGKQIRDSVLVCDYVPAGNFVGKPIYQQGTACGTCNATCSKKYPGLCT